MTTPSDAIRRDHELAGKPALGALLPIEKRLAMADKVAARNAATDLEAAVASFREWLHLPDPGALYAALGAVMANVLPGDPVWLLLVGPPGCGKTETIAPLAALDFVHSAAVVTPAALLSGTARRELEKGATGGLLHQVGEFGILLVKDLGSILSQHREARAEALAALREVYDGRYDRPVGTGGGRVLSWAGKCGLVAGVTPTIDRHHGVMAAMGERFCLYRLEVDDPAKQARRRIGNRRHEVQMRADLAAAVTRVIAGAALNPPDLTTTEIETIVAWSTFAVWARTGVERDGYNHEVQLMPSVEAPARLAGTLAAMHTGLCAIGATEADVWRIITKLAWDSIPDLRRRLLNQLRAGHSDLYTADLVALTGVPRTTAERTLEDLALLGLVEGHKKGDYASAPWTWNVAEPATEAWPPTSPEMSGGKNSDLRASSEMSGRPH